MKGFREQIGWLSRFIGDSLDVLMTGTQVLDSTGKTAFYREYRFSAESNKRAPLIVVHLFFDDSTSLKIAGAYNKTFDNDTKNRIADAQIWHTPTGDIDIHSISYMEFDQGILPIIRVYDDSDTTALDSARADAKGSPIVREVIARGFLDKIKAAKPTAHQIDRFGVAFIRMDPLRGYTQFTFALSPEAYRDTSMVKKNPAKTGKAPVKAKASAGTKKAK
jgi:hypothetical protein